jgi:putative ABC transport system permease protein
MTAASGRPAVPPRPAAPPVRPAGPAVPVAARLRPADLAALASAGLRARPLRAAMSALGIAIGIAAIVAVLGLAASSNAALIAEIRALGTNLLTITSGQDLSGNPAELPIAAPAMIARLPGVTAVQDTGTVNGAHAYRSRLIPPLQTNALTVAAATLGLPAAARASVAQGRFLNAATTREPVAVLGAAAAQRLGIDRIGPGERICLGASPASGQWFYITGILNPSVGGVAPEIDSAVLIGFPAAGHYLHFDGHPSEIYVRTASNPAATTRVDALLAAQASPENPSQAGVSQPSAALTAQADANRALGTLYLGLGAVALLVGAIGVANIMIISVLERRSEIGLRRALGATRGQIRAQFLAEAILLSLAGGTAGVLGGAAATASYATAKHWATIIPPQAWAGGLAAALLTGALAGLLPAIRAARQSPTQALWSI